MLYHNRIGVSEGIDVNKRSVFTESIICIVYDLLQATVCNIITNLNIHGLDYHCIIARITKNEALNLSAILDLNEKSGSLFFYI